MVDVIEEIKDNVKKGEEAIEEILEEGTDATEKVIKKGKKLVKDLVKESTEVSKKIEKKIKKTLDKKPKKKSDEEFSKKDSEKDAEQESLKTEESPEKPIKDSKIQISDLSKKDLADKKKELLEKVKKLSKKVDITKTKDLKEQVKIKKRADMLIPLEEYVKAGIYLGTKVITPKMRPFVYRRRADGLAIFNTDLIDEKLKEGIEYLSKFDTKDIILICKRQAGWKAAKMFSDLTGIRVFTKKYPAGVLTNIQLPDFFENELTIIIDSWLDKNALHDTLKVNKKVLMVCDTNNFPTGADQIIIGNNKSAKSLGVIFYLLTRGFCKAKDIQADIPDLEWWTSERE